MHDPVISYYEGLTAKVIDYRFKVAKAELGGAFAFIHCPDRIAGLIKKDTLLLVVPILKATGVCTHRMIAWKLNSEDPWSGLNPTLSNDLVARCLAHTSLKLISRECPLERSRLDLLVSENGKSTYIEVKTAIPRWWNASSKSYTFPVSLREVRGLLRGPSKKAVSDRAITHADLLMRVSGKLIYLIVYPDGPRPTFELNINDPFYDKGKLIPSYVMYCFWRGSSIYYDGMMPLNF